MIRILHRFDLERKTRIMEERLDGSGPWYLVEEGKESDEAGYVTEDTGVMWHEISNLSFKEHLSILLIELVKRVSVVILVLLVAFSFTWLVLLLLSNFVAMELFNVLDYQFNPMRRCISH